MLISYLALCVSALVEMATVLPSSACPYGVSHYSGGKEKLLMFPDQSSSGKKARGMGSLNLFVN